MVQGNFVTLGESLFEFLKLEGDLRLAIDSLLLRHYTIKSKYIK